jgi:hypothetical protein
MKKQMMQFAVVRTVGKFFRTAAIVVMLTGTYAVAQAASATYAITERGAGLGKTEITHVSTSDQSLVFQINVENSSAEKFLISIKDQNGTTIYRGYFNDKDFSKKFILPKEDTGKLTFSIRGSEGTETESFQINSNTRVIEEVLVTKLN